MDFGSQYEFPDIESASAEGLLAVGADLEPSTLLEAYSHGIFPWFSDGDPILWWSLDPRMVLFVNEIHISKSLQRVIKSDKFSVSFDSAFDEIIDMCASVDRGEDNGVWITEEMKEAYKKLHNYGFAHSVEVRTQDKIVGGLYGVSVGRMFFGESMVSTVSNASKVALAVLTKKLKSLNIEVIDCQQETEHMARMGARPIPRSEFKNVLTEAMKHKTHKGCWT